MVKNLGVAAQTMEGWTYVDTSGDPYSGASQDQREYGTKYLLPFSKGRNVRLMWEMIPSKAAVLVSFLRCIPCRISYNEPMEVLVLPGDRSILSRDGKVFGYNDLVGGMLYMFTDQGSHDSWRYVLSKLHRARYIAGGGATQHEGEWIEILTNLVSGLDIGELTEELQSRLQWELRIRLGA